MKKQLLMAILTGTLLSTNAMASEWEGYVDGFGGSIDWVNVESITTNGINLKVSYWVAKVHPNGGMLNVYLDLRSIDCTAVNPQCTIERRMYLNNKLLDVKKPLKECQTSPYLYPDEEIACGVSKKRTLKREFKDVKSMVETTREIIQKYEKDSNGGVIPYVF